MNWTEKYRPKSMNEFVDGMGFYQPFIRWLKEWKSDGESKSAVLYGPPGTGKTTMVLVAAKSLGMTVHMTNASDARNKDDVLDIWRVAMTSGLDGSPRLILLDEADHISDSGRGKTAQDLVIEMVNKSRHPVVLTCNDLYGLNREIRASKAFKFKFRYPTRSDKIETARRIVRSEKLDMDIHEIGHIVDASKTYRALIYNLQRFSMGIFELHTDISEEGMYDEFMSIMEGHPPERTNFIPGDLLKWTVEYAPQHFDEIFAANNILSRIRGERSTKDVHQHAWKYSGRILRQIRGIVDRRKMTVNDRRVQLPFESMRIYAKIKTDNPKEKLESKKAKVTRGKKEAPKPVVNKATGLSKWA